MSWRDSDVLRHLDLWWLVMIWYVVQPLSETERQMTSKASMDLSFGNEWIGAPLMMNCSNFETDQLDRFVNFGLIDLMSCYCLGWFIVSLMLRVPRGYGWEAARGAGIVVLQVLEQVCRLEEEAPMWLLAKVYDSSGLIFSLGASGSLFDLLRSLWVSLASLWPFFFNFFFFFFWLLAYSFWWRDGGVFIGIGRREFGGNGVRNGGRVCCEEIMHY